MKKKSLGFLIGLVLVLVAIDIVFASQGNKFGKSVTPLLPQPVEKDLQKVIFIRYAPGKGPTCDNDGLCEPKENWKNCPNDCPKEGEPTPTPEETVCYGFLSGAKPKWNWVEGYAYSAADLGQSSALATTIWGEATSATIFGAGVPETYPWGVYDYQNAISYGDYSDPNVIAVTAIWFRAKNIYEYDIMFDTNYFSESNVDLDTVVLHEFGHGAGLNDLYNSVCSDEVMYGYYTGVKTALSDGDITGIQTLYGK